MDRVWSLSERLRGDGVDCRVDQQQQSLWRHNQRLRFRLTRVFNVRPQDVHNA